MGGREPRLAETATAVAPGSAGRELGTRYLAHLAGLALLLGIFEHWDLLPVGAVLVLVIALAAVTVTGNWLALQGRSRRESARELRNHVTPLMAVLVAAAASLMVPDWRLHLGIQLLMAVTIFTSSYVTLERFCGRFRPEHEFVMNAGLILILLGAYLGVMAATDVVPVRLAVIFVVTGLAAYELLGRVAAEQVPAVVGTLVVAQIVTTVAFALFSLQFVDSSRVAGVLLVAWYVNRDLLRHLFEGTLTRNILAEYSVGLVVAAALLGSAMLAR